MYLFNHLITSFIGHALLLSSSENGMFKTSPSTRNFNQLHQNQVIVKWSLDRFVYKRSPKVS